MIRWSPGFGIDEHELDPTRDVQALRARDAALPERQDFVTYCLSRTAAMFRGDLGISRTWNRPVAALLEERWRVTARLMAIGFVGGWGLALVCALPQSVYPLRWWNAIAGGLSSLLLCVPVAALALVFFVWAGPARLIMALAVFPKIFQYLRNLLAHAADLPHVLAARARGLNPLRILLWHILPAAAPETLALAGVSVSMAFGAAVAVEVICDFPGIGQLAWKAALARDLPLLVTLTMLVTLTTQLANAIADGLAVATGRSRP